jgi:hypothetical protein
MIAGVPLLPRAVMASSALAVAVLMTSFLEYMTVMMPVWKVCEAMTSPVMKILGSMVRALVQGLARGAAV